VLTLTRTGDADLTNIDDPTTLPPRKNLLANGFHGRYKFERSRPGGKSVQATGLVDTYCLRTVERCMSFFYSDNASEPFVFSEGRWVLNYSGPINCRPGPSPRVRVDRTATMELPDPPADPMNVLTGAGHDHIDDPRCPDNHDFDLRFEQVGD
jgi:hypothetical protein